MSALYELQGVESTIREIDGIVSLDSSTALENLLSVWLQVLTGLPGIDQIPSTVFESSSPRTTSAC